MKDSEDITNDVCTKDKNGKLCFTNVAKIKHSSIIMKII